MSADQMKNLTYGSIAVIVVSLFFIGIELTGYATSDSGVVNVTIDTAASIVFTTDDLYFGNGTITPSQTAIINSEGGNIGSYWSGSAPTTGLILENDGNINVSVELRSNKTAADFIGGTSPDFQVKVESTTEANSCGNITNFASYESITTSNQVSCANLGYEASQDVLDIDVQLTMNDDASGAKTVGIIATATAA